MLLRVKMGVCGERSTLGLIDERTAILNSERRLALGLTDVGD